MKTLILCIAMQFAIFVGAYSQSAELNLISTAGDYFETDNLSISWSVGEVLTEAFSTNDLYLGQGFQQGGDFTTGISQMKPNEFNIELFPNPATTEFSLNLIDFENRRVDYQLQLFDISGQLVMAEKLYNDFNKIDIKEIKSGTYFVRLIDNEKAINKIFILEKVNY
ncbi:MAG: T9SS type A sorting domain-containing protein [Salinivirgaceae bacterium]|nr:T9SS type A sorting domain-containing protein [Salinivirgaceae bacterium]